MDQPWLQQLSLRFCVMTSIVKEQLPWDGGKRPQGYMSFFQGTKVGNDGPGCPLMPDALLPTIGGRHNELT